MRSINILTINTVAPRVAALRAIPDCVVVAITDAHTRGSGLSESKYEEELSWAASGVPTTLGRIKRHPAIWLLIHGYWNAQAELFAKFGCPRSYNEPRAYGDRFERLILPKSRAETRARHPRSSPSYRKHLRESYESYTFRGQLREVLRDEKYIIRLIVSSRLGIDFKLP